MKRPFRGNVERSREPENRAASAALPIVSLALFALTVSLILIAASKTLGYDFEAYWQAAHRLAAGERLYDPNVSVAGGFAIYLYPPPFALAVAGLTFLPHDAALLVWEVMLVACLPLGAWLMPVAGRVRWSVLLLAALNWPFLYALRLGQVGPILFLVFVAVWRWRDRATTAAAAMTVGALVKVQPGILVAWAAVTGRWKAAVLSAVFAAIAAAVATVATGPGVWPDYLSLLSRVSPEFTVAKNASPGAVAHLAGASPEVASALQWAAIALAAATVLAAWRYAEPVVSLQVTLVASQLLSPLLWEHYAMLLLVPTAWLLERGRKWAIVFPLSGWLAVLAFPTTASGVGPAASAATSATSSAGGSWLAAATIPLAFYACLAVLLLEARRETPSETSAAELATRTRTVPDQGSPG